MAIQHRLIPDTELHEPKGADSAIGGSVLTATGTGSTEFKFIGVSQLQGALPTTSPGLTVKLDGIGGFKAEGEEYASFTSTIVGGNTTTTKTSGTSGIFVSGAGFKVTTPGTYLVSFSNPVFLTGDGDTIPYSLVLPTLFNISSTSTIFTGASGIVQLNAEDEYVSGEANSYSIVRIS